MAFFDQTFYEPGTDAYKEDLARRNGGLTSGRDKDKIEQFKQLIQSDRLSDQEIELLIHRNPRAAGEFAAVKQNRDKLKQLNDITARNLRAPQAPFTQEGPMLPGEERLNIPAQPGQFNLQQATAEAAKAGIFNPQVNQQFQNLAQTFEPPQAVQAFSKINPSDYTPESLKTFQKTADFSTLVPRQTGDKSFDRETKLRGEFVKQSGEFIKVRDSFSRIEESAVDPSAAGDLSLIFNYMKMLDPDSVVRESEFATAANAAGVPDRVRALWNKILSGERLAEGTRGDFVNRAQRLFKRQQLQHDKRKKTFSGLAKRAGLSPDNVVIDITQAKRKEQDLGGGWKVKVE